MSESEVREKIEEICTGIIETFADEIDPELPAFMMAHITATDARLAGTERPAVIGHDPTILTSVLANRAFDYVALGHVHRHQDLNPGGQPHVIYPGSIERVDFGEEHVACGFCIVDHQEKGKTGYRFIETPARAFITIELDVKTDENPTERIIREIQKERLAGAIVRVIYTVPEASQPVVDLKAIRDALEDAFLVAAIIRKTEEVERVRRATVSEGLNLMDALDRYFENNPSLEPFKEDMKTYAGQLELELQDDQVYSRSSDVEKE
jgi:exonuclease SbcD